MWHGTAIPAVLRHNVAWHGIKWRGAAWCDAVWHFAAQCGVMRHVARYGTMWHGAAQCTCFNFFRVFNANDLIVSRIFFVICMDFFMRNRYGLFVVFRCQFAIMYMLRFCNDNEKTT